MKELLKAGQVLGRSEMKKIMAGSGESTNCIICENSSHCISHVGPTPAPGCNYGICPEC